MPSSSTTTLLTALLVALALYLSLTFVLLPLVRQHRARYESYVPLRLRTSLASSSLRDQLAGLVTAIVLRRRFGRGNGPGDEDDDDDDELELGLEDEEVEEGGEGEYLPTVAGRRV